MYSFDFGFICNSSIDHRRSTLVASIEQISCHIRLHNSAMSDLSCDDDFHNISTCVDNVAIEEQKFNDVCINCLMPFDILLQNVLQCQKKHRIRKINLPL